METPGSRRSCSATRTARCAPAPSSTRSRVDEDLNWHPFLAESITPNADNTEFTIKLRSGIKFHDGTDLNADAAMYNFNDMVRACSSASALKDVARDADGNAVMDKVDDLTFTITHRRSRGRFPFSLAAQAGLVGSSTVARRRRRRYRRPDDPRRHRPVHVRELRPWRQARREEEPGLLAARTPPACSCPYLDEIEFRVISDSQVAEQRARGGDIDMIATSDCRRSSATFKDNADFTTGSSRTYGETELHPAAPQPEGSPLQRPRSPLRARPGHRQAGPDRHHLQRLSARRPTDRSRPARRATSRTTARCRTTPRPQRRRSRTYEAANGPVDDQLLHHHARPTTSPGPSSCSDAWGDVGVDVDDHPDRAVEADQQRAVRRPGVRCLRLAQPRRSVRRPAVLLVARRRQRCPPASWRSTSAA